MSGLHAASNKSISHKPCGAWDMDLLDAATHRSEPYLFCMGLILQNFNLRRLLKKVGLK